MKVFEIDGKLYSKVTPTKRLFNSTTVHEVVNRGDIFAIRLEDMVLTVLTKDVVANAESINAYIVPHSEAKVPKTQRVNVSAERKKLMELRNSLQAVLDQKELQ